MILQIQLWHSGWWCCEDVSLVLEEEVVDKLLHLLDIAIVDGCPSFLYDLVNLGWVCGVGARLVWLVRVCWSLDGLHGLGVLLLNGFGYVGLSMWTLESGNCALVCLFG